MHFPTRREVLKLSALSAATTASRNLLWGAAAVTVEPQPLCAQTRRLLEALDDLGAPPKPPDLESLEQLLKHPESGEVVAPIQAILDTYALFDVAINPEARVSVSRGAAHATLWQNGWSVFLVKVNNQGGVTGRLRCSSQQALADSGQAPNSQITATGIVPPGSSVPVQSITKGDVADRWLDLQMYEKPPLTPELGGLAVEYRVIQLYSRDSGQREAVFSFGLGPGSEDLGHRNSVAVLFTCDPAHRITLRVRDFDASSATASFIVRDKQRRVYPSRAKRLAPDFPFQDQIYRADKDHILLPQGTYDITFDRGPEYKAGHQQLVVGTETNAEASFQLERWVNPPQFGWYGGDHHVHAAGCSHYNTPTQGVLPSDMAVQVRGEGLCFADILTWGPCWYYQKQFFRASIDPSSGPKSVLRYDVEVSGFPSSYWGHLVLLSLKEQDFPGAKKIEDWPTWNLPILQWARGQRSVTGYAHTGHGLSVPSNDLPNLLIPKFDDNGANEFLIDLAHGLVDFLSAADTPALAELNLWYHTLNCGFKIPIAGETDFPCLFEKVGVGRSYVHLQNRPAGDAGYREWIQGLRAGRSYVSDGRSHILGLEVCGKALSEEDHEIQLDRTAPLSVTAKLAAYLPDTLSNQAVRIRSLSLDKSPFWHIERARVSSSRRVPVELVVNGNAVARKEIEADGSIQTVRFDMEIDRSSWVAVRIFPTCHSNPLYVLKDRKPIRATKASAEWCLECIDAAWQRLGPRIARGDQQKARSAMQQAKAVFQGILAQTVKG